jgi:hypothetical protein
VLHKKREGKMLTDRAATASAQRRFLEINILRLESEIHDAWVDVSGDNWHLRPSIMVCWAAINKAIGVPSNVQHIFVDVLEAQRLAQGNKLTENQIVIAASRIDAIVTFLLRCEFPKMNKKRG